jgi:hypothetical protein
MALSKIPQKEGGLGSLSRMMWRVFEIQRAKV